MSGSDFDGVVLLESDLHHDMRGWFLQVYETDDLIQAGIPTSWAHFSTSLSRSPGTVRGMHFQVPPHEQGKFVVVMSGRIFDVVVDIRPGSQTLYRHLVYELAPGEALFIPGGFAHGYCTLEPNAQVSYLMTDKYSPDHAHGLRWNDPALGIDWPVAERDAILSERDRNHPLISTESQ